MNNIKQYVPRNIIREEISVSFSTLEELQKIKFVEMWVNELDLFKLSIDRKSYKMELIAEMTDGEYWTIGTLEKDVPELDSFDLKNCCLRRK